MLRAIRFATMLVVAAGLTPLQAETGRRGPACDTQSLEQAKQEFRRLRSLRRENPSHTSDAEFRAASLQYVGLAEECYQSISGREAPTGLKIDDGGVWFSALDGIDARAASQPSPSPYRKHSLTGTKWGSGSSFLTCCDNPDAQGPRLPGGTVTYSIMANGVDLSVDCGGGCVNTAITSLPTVESCCRLELSDALGAWSAVADIQFVPVTDGGLPFNTGSIGDIRIGAHPFDGDSGTLAHAFFPPPNGTTAAGDLHLDSAEDWSCDPTMGSIDVGLVLLHELGHSLGLNHEVSDPAVMEAFYNPALTFGPLADDIIGIGEIYGGSPVGKSFFFGDLGIGTDNPAASLHVQRTDGSARLLVEETNGTAADRRLIDIRNNGPASFTIRNTAMANNWNFTAANFNFFQISQIGSGVLEFTLKRGGDATFAGNVTANGILLTSDRDLKENIEPVDSLEVLRKVVDLPISRWNLKNRPTEPHIGPMAQDFHEILQVGDDERKISPIDTGGTALAAVQGLYELVRKQAEQLELQRQEINTLRQRLQKLEAR